MISFLFVIVNIFILSYSFIMGVAISRKNYRLSTPLALAGLAVLFTQCAITFYPEIEYALFGFTYYAFVRWWGLAGAFLTLGAHFDRMNPGIRNLLLLVSIAIFILTAIYWDNFVAENSFNFKEEGWHGGICAQSTNYTSACASCATMLKHFGVNASEKQMAKLCLTDKRGTAHIYIARGLQMMLDPAVYKIIIARVKWEELQNIPAPFITKIYLSTGAAHTVAVIKADAEEIKFTDPLAKKEITLTQAEFIKNWGSLIIYAARK